MKIQVYVKDPRKDRDVMVGVIHVKNSTFIKTVKRVDHFLRVVDGYAIQREVFDTLKANKVEKIVVDETDTGDTYWAPVGTWLNKGRRWTKGHGEQIALSMRYMRKVIKNA